MRVVSGLLLAVTLLHGGAMAQGNAAPTSEPPPAPNAQSTVLRANAQLVIIDVVVRDKNGNLVSGLKPSDFVLAEDKAPQSLINFEEHTGVQPQAASRTLPTLPPGVFTDYDSLPSSDTLNVILVDTLNTPLQYQPYLQAELHDYIRNARPGAPTAIFGLSTNLILLQGFTSDPAILRAAIDTKLVERASSFLPDPSGLNADIGNVSQPQGDMIKHAPTVPTSTSIANAGAAMAQFKAPANVVQLQARIQLTLNAFNELGNYLSEIPGRKNVIWYSAAFPLTIVPDPSLPEEDSVPVQDLTQFHETLNLLTRARVAVYPVDARGIQVNPVFDMAYNAGPGISTPSSFSADSASFNANLAAEQVTMRTIAEDTGGEAFINTNNLTKATNLAISSSSEYYSLAYSPSDHQQNGKFRSVHVDLSSSAHANGARLFYRKGYYSPDQAHPHQTVDSAEAPGADPSHPNDAYSYARATMKFGAPQPSDFLFTARVLPASAASEPQLARDNVLDPLNPLRAPYRSFDVDLAAFPRDVHMLLLPNGNRAGKLQFALFLYDPDGKLLNTSQRSLTYNLTPDNYRHFLQSPINFHMEISAPPTKESFLRIGVEDLVSKHLGAVEVPVSSVIHLAPPVYSDIPTR